MSKGGATIPFLQSSDSKFNQYQVQLQKALKIIMSCPISYGRVLERVQLLPGEANAIPHGLGRNLQGWFLTRQRAEGGAATLVQVQDGQDQNSAPDKTLVLYTTQAITVDIWVY